MREIKIPKIKISIYQQDWIPGFAAFMYEGRDELIKKDGVQANVVLNIGGIMATLNDDIEKKEVPYIISECIMHEVIHVLEAYFSVEFNEEKVESLINKYIENYKDK